MGYTMLKTAVLAGLFVHAVIAAPFANSSSNGLVRAVSFLIVQLSPRFYVFCVELKSDF